MRARLRRLERRLARERTEVAVRPIVADFAQRWHEALRQDAHPPDVLELIDGLRRANVYLPSVPAAISYLDGCLQRRSPPDTHRLLHRLLPWHT